MPSAAGTTAPQAGRSALRPRRCMAGMGDKRARRAVKCCAQQDLKPTSRARTLPRDAISERSKVPIVRLKRKPKPAGYLSRIGRDTPEWVRQRSASLMEGVAHHLNRRSGLKKSRKVLETHG